MLNGSLLIWRLLKKIMPEIEKSQHLGVWNHPCLIRMSLAILNIFV